MIKAIGIFLSLFIAQALFAQSESDLRKQNLRILSPTAAQAAYLSSELTGVLPFWVMDARLVDTDEAREGVYQGKIACTLWLLDFSTGEKDNKSRMIATLFVSQKQIPLWKRVNGKAIFVDEASGYALSYSCVYLDPQKGLSELESLEDKEFNRIFRGLLKIQP